MLLQNSPSVRTPLHSFPGISIRKLAWRPGFKAFTDAEERLGPRAARPAARPVIQPRSPAGRPGEPASPPARQQTQARGQPRRAAEQGGPVGRLAGRAGRAGHSDFAGGLSTSSDDRAWAKGSTPRRAYFVHMGLHVKRKWFSLLYWNPI